MHNEKNEKFLTSEEAQIELDNSLAPIASYWYNNALNMSVPIPIELDTFIMRYLKNNLPKD